MLAFVGLVWVLVGNDSYSVSGRFRSYVVLRLTFSICSSLACSLCTARLLGKNPFEKLEINLPASVIMHAEFPTYTWQTWPRFSPHLPLPQAAETHMAKLPLNGFGRSRGERDDETEPLVWEPGTHGRDRQACTHPLGNTRRVVAQSSALSTAYLFNTTRSQGPTQINL